MFRRNINIFNIKTKKKNIYIKSGCSFSSNNNIKGNKITLSGESFIQSLIKYIGQTITIYTGSGGVSGSGFTGVLLQVCKDHIKILTGIASPPNSALGNSCKVSDKEDSREDSCEISLGSITEIPLDKIVAFIHNTVG